MQEFIDWYAGLAPKSETVLIVRQKPQLKEGQLQHHKDGALKCTWPAMLPNKWKPEQALYGNTGLFIIDRFKDGYPSAAAANVEYCAVMVLDDVGTDKVQTPPLTPTWRIETSPGCEQWGYVFSEQPTKADFSAAIIAIAEAGYTDRGAINPVRNWRLPGSINLKPGRNNFAARLLEWNRKTEYTLEEICAALDVVPGQASTAQHSAVQLLDDGKDNVAAWLSAQGLVIEPPNSAGWMGVICPNAAEHSDGSPMGRYSPVNRAYCCLHAHCHDWTSSRFLNWVASEGGPAVETGLREELIVDTMSKVMDRLEASKAESGSQFSENTNAAAVLEAVERAEIGRVEKAEWFRRFAYIHQDDAYYDMERRNVVSRAAFNALYRHIDTKSIHGKGSRVAPSIVFDQLRQSSGARVLDSLTYAAGEGELVASSDGLVYGNRWSNGRPVTVANGSADVSPWLALWARLVPDDMERKHILDVLAFKMQNPKLKINHALLIAGGQGIGKDTALAPFLWAIGGKDSRNVAIVKNDELASRWGYALECEVMLVNELRQSEAKDRRALDNTLKPIIAAPPEKLSVEQKGMHPYYVLNRLLVIAYSNERAAIALPSEDRRWFVVWSDAGKLLANEARSIWQWYEKGGFEAIAGYLLMRDVSAFDPSEQPPMTDAKLAMVSSARSAAEEYLIDMILSRRGDFMHGVIASPFFSLLDRLKVGFSGNPNAINKSVLNHALREAGWRDCGMVLCREYLNKKHLFCAPGMFEEYTKSDLRRMVEKPPEPTLVKVKG